MKSIPCCVLLLAVGLVSGCATCREQPPTSTWPETRKETNAWEELWHALLGIAVNSAYSSGVQNAENYSR